MLGFALLPPNLNFQVCHASTDESPYNIVCATDVACGDCSQYLFTLPNNGKNPEETIGDLLDIIDGLRGKDLEQ